MRWVLLIIAVFALTLLQTSFLPLFEFLGVGPNLLLVSLCCLAVLREPQETVIAVALAGILTGLMAFQGVAESVASLTPIAFAGMLWRGEPGRSTWLAALTLTAAASALHFAALSVAVEFTTTGVNWLEAARDVMLPSVAVNLILAVPVYLVAQAIPRLRADDRRDRWAAF